VPVRIQRKRTKGWTAPDGAVYVGRPGRWGNPFSVKMYGAGLAVRNYRGHITGLVSIGARDLSELRGKDLMCWCPLDQPCHADVLLEIANK
jgi:hypothetical protein